LRRRKVLNGRSALRRGKVLHRCSALRRNIRVLNRCGALLSSERVLHGCRTMDFRHRRRVVRSRRHVLLNGTVLLVNRGRVLRSSPMLLVDCSRVRSGPVLLVHRRRMRSSAMLLIHRCRVLRSVPALRCTVRSNSRTRAAGEVIRRRVGTRDRCRCRTAMAYR
jgi:hypothetical protein